MRAGNGPARVGARTRQAMVRGCDTGCADATPRSSDRLEGLPERSDGLSGVREGVRVSLRGL